MSKQDESVTEDDIVVTRAVMGPEWGIYALVFMQVCAYGECPPELVERRANELNPPGSSAPWSIVWGNDPDDDMNNERLAPVACVSDPARMHYMLSC